MPPEELPSDAGAADQEIVRLTNELADVRKENDILRGIVARQNIPCTYCGLTDMSKCTHGFPGCSRADDILCAEETELRVLLDRIRKYESYGQETKS